MLHKRRFEYCIYLIISILLLSFEESVNAKEPETIVIRCNWGDIQQRSLFIEKYRNQYTDNQPNKGLTSSCKVKLKVIRDNETNKELEWVFQDIQVNDSTPLVKALSKITEGLRIVYRVDQNGAFLELVNVDEVKTFLDHSLDYVSQQLPQNSLYSQAFEQLKSTYKTKEDLETFYLQDIRLYHLPCGQEVSLGIDKSDDILLPNILGGEAFTGTLITKAEISKSSDNHNVISIQMNQVLDKDKIAKILSSSTRSSSNQRNPTSIQLKDKNMFEWDSFSGLILNAEHQRETQIEGMRRIDNLKISHIN
ncbi:MAG: hypothetical protein ACK481_04000 [Candidatus Melainabacteria bacterium]|jgi:hypothetical protein